MRRTINPDREKLPEVLANIPKDRPIIMINLLRFRKTALYRNEEMACSGREAYRTYSQTAEKKVREVGGKPVWMGKVFGSLIAPEGEIWDEALLVRYPSIEAFTRMIAMPDYQKAAVHRTAALEDSRLIATVESEIGF